MTTAKRPRGRPGTGRTTRVIRLPTDLIEKLETAAEPYGTLAAFLSEVAEGNFEHSLAVPIRQFLKDNPGTNTLGMVDPLSALIPLWVAADKYRTTIQRQRARNSPQVEAMTESVANQVKTGRVTIITETAHRHYYRRVF